MVSTFDELRPQDAGMRSSRVAVLTACLCPVQTGHDIKKNIPGTDEHAMHNPTRGTGAEGVKNAAKVRLTRCVWRI